ncbi:MAG TPA: N-formylglutamate amidohydrolase [Steroidobacteraceae bacterium]|nr:N-formylglutamate amidohydrolase [Steroidobacteraceae bacterium]
MTSKSKTGLQLLAPEEPAAVQVERVSGGSPFLLICDHAGNRIPRSLASLGLPAAELERHIAWDIGAAAVALRLGELLDATVILQRYSRLVIDCNRPPTSPQSIVTVSERTGIPGNQNLTAEDRARRHAEIFAPYHARITAALDRRQRQGQPTLLLAMHSFTPVFLDAARTWHVGMLYNRDVRLAHALGAALRAEPELVVGDNQPYAVSDATDYAIPEYGERRGLPHVEIEIRQDLIAAESGAERWASLLARLLPPLVEPLIT